MLYKQERRKEMLMAFGLIFPTIISFMMFLYIPFINAIRIGFYRFTGMAGMTDFIGLDNYIAVLNDPMFQTSLWNTFLVMLASVGIGIPIGFALAYILYIGVPGARFFQVSLFIPFLISMVVVGVIWRVIFDPIIGPINQLLVMVGMEQHVTAWLSRRETALGAVTITWIWRTVPFNMLIMYANILKMPSDFIEAADIDGATTFQKLRYVIIPYMASTFNVLVILVVTNTLRLFDLVWVMTRGGPGGATEVITSFIYRRSFEVQNIGQGTAASIMLMVIMLVIMGVVSIGKVLLRRRYSRD